MTSSTLTGLRPPRLAGDRLERMLRRSPSQPGPSSTAPALGALGPTEAALVVGRLSIRWAGVARARPASGTAAQGDAGGELAQDLVRSAGRPLPQSARERLEPAFQADFRRVRIHTDTLAARLSERLNAHAFTIGEDVYFARGRFDTGSPSGLALLGHELTHVVQNQGGTGLLRRKPAPGAAGENPRPPKAPARRPIGIGPRLEQDGFAQVRRRGPIALAGNDAFERQAVANERLLLGGDALPTVSAAPSRRATLRRKDAGPAGPAPASAASLSTKAPGDAPAPPTVGAPATLEDLKRLVIGAVQQDKESFRRIKSWLSAVMPDALGWTGETRNLGFFLAGLVASNKFDPSNAEIASQVCTGISEAAWHAIEKAHIPGVTAGAIDRCRHGVYHTAVVVSWSPPDGSTPQRWVFDWHATLNPSHPIISTVPEWLGAPDPMAPAAAPTAVSRREAGPADTGPVEPEFARDLGRSSGRPLAGAVRNRFETFFERDLGSVRIHTDALANTLAARVNAFAFTVGTDLYFGRGRFDTASPEGLALLGHELTHVVQNQGGSTIRRKSAFPAQAHPADVDSYNRQAAAEAKRFAREIDAAVKLYRAERGPVDMKDPQEHGAIFCIQAYANGHFNNTRGSKAAQADLAGWFKAAQDGNRTVSETDVVYRALEATGGNLPLAIGTVAGLFHDQRDYASVVSGLGNNSGEDYYRYAGAFIGLQEATLRAAGTSFALADITLTQANAFARFGNPYKEKTDAKLYQIRVGQWAMNKIQRRGVALGTPNDAAEREAHAIENRILASLRSGRARSDQGDAGRTSSRPSRVSEWLPGLVSNDTTVPAPSPQARPVARVVVRRKAVPQTTAGPGTPTSGLAADRATIARQVAGLSDHDFGEILHQMNTRAFAHWIWDGVVVKSPELFQRFLDYTQGCTIPVNTDEIVPAFHMALELIAVQASGGNGGVWGKGKDKDGKDDGLVRKIVGTAAGAGDKAGNKLKSDLVKGEFLKKIKEIRELKDIWQEHTKLKQLSDIELWRWARVLDAETFEKRVLKAADSEEIVKRLGSLFSGKGKRWEFNKKGAEEILRTLQSAKKNGGKGTVAEFILKKAPPRMQAKVAALGPVPEQKGAFGTFVDKVVEKIKKMLEPIEEIFHKGEEIVRNFAKEDGPVSRVVREMLNIGSKIKDSFFAFFRGEKGVFSWLKEAGHTILDLLKPMLESKFMKGVTKYAGKFMKAMPWVALGGDLLSWALGPRELAEKAEKQELPSAKRVLEDGGIKAWLLTDAYFGVAVGTDLISCLASVLLPGPQAPIAVAVALGADTLNLAWTGISFGAGDWTKAVGRKLHWDWLTTHGINFDWGGLGLPILDSMLADEPRRKKRGFTRYDDDDPELTRIHSEVVRRHHDGPGVSLDLSTKYRLERMLGRDIGEVRLHTGPVATALTRATEAEAVTSGRDVYMPSGTLDARTPEGLGLLAHEVTHVVQSGAASPTASPRALGGGSTGEVLERVAHAIERRVVAQARAPRYAVMDGVVRDAPAPTPVAAPAAAPSFAVASTPAPAEARASAEPAVSRYVGGGELSPAAGEASVIPVHMDLDPIETVFVEYAVPQRISQEEFLDIVKDRVLDLMREDMSMEAERSGTMTWDDSLPQS